MNIHHQKKTSKKLFIAKMNKTKTISKYYHRLFKFWQRVETSLKNRIDMFIESINLDIFQILQIREYKNFTRLLKNVKRIENYRKNVINNFYFNKNKFEKSIQFTTSNRNNPKNPTQAIESKINISNVKLPHFNEKFGSMNKNRKNKSNHDTIKNEISKNYRKKIESN